MAYETITAETENGVCTVRLNRPEVRNALGLEARNELRDFFTKANEDDAIRSILLTGNGPAFSAGGDLSQMEGLDPVKGRKRLQSGHAMIQAMIQLEKPIIAAVNGPAAGAGVSVALASDIIIAARSSVFIQSFVHVGLIPDLGSIYFLPRLVGRHKAMELMMTGEKIPAAEAHRLGFVNKVVDDETLLDEALMLAQKLSDGPSHSIGLTKRLVNRSVLSDIDHTLEEEGLAQGICFQTDDFQEGRNAFFGKRKPNFHARTEG
ncbi:enoyl-CoA hydratase/isomerase family protein [Pradoshia sp.]